MKRFLIIYAIFINKKFAIIDPHLSGRHLRHLSAARVRDLHPYLLLSHTTKTPMLSLLK
jgi:hypothetical protein